MAHLEWNNILKENVMKKIYMKLIGKEIVINYMRILSEEIYTKEIRSEIVPN